MEYVEHMNETLDLYFDPAPNLFSGQRGTIVNHDLDSLFGFEFGFEFTKYKPIVLYRQVMLTLNYFKLDMSIECFIPRPRLNVGMLHPSP